MNDDSIGSVWKSNLGYTFAYCGCEILYGESYIKMRSTLFGTGYNIIYAKLTTFYDDFTSVDIDDILNIGDVWVSDTGEKIIINSFTSYKFSSNVSVEYDHNVLKSVTVDVMLHSKKVGMTVNLTPKYFIDTFKRVKDHERL